jgi:hypothetical protein
MELEDPEEIESFGDRVCYLESVCAQCGALVEAQLPTACWRCGATVARV